MIAALALLLALDTPPVAGQVEVLGGIDTNVNRVPDGRIGENPGHITPTPAPNELPEADGVMQASGALTVELARPGLVLHSDDALGAKLYGTHFDQHMLVAQSFDTLTAQNVVPGGGVLTLALLAKARAQASLVRTYAVIDSTASVDEPIVDGLSLIARIDGQGFNSFDAPLFTSAGAFAVLGARAYAGPESITLVGSGGARGYPYSLKSLAPAASTNETGQRRADGELVGSLSATSARRLYLSIDYTLTRDVSNAAGESFTRHRLSALLGVRLPQEVDVTAHAALQLTQYDDGVSIGQIYFLGDVGDDSQNLLEITMSRALFAGLSAVATVGVYGNEFAVEGARFSRQTAALGIRCDL